MTHRFRKVALPVWQTWTGLWGEENASGTQDRFLDLPACVAYLLDSISKCGQACGLHVLHHLQKLIHQHDCGPFSSTDAAWVSQHSLPSSCEGWQRDAVTGNRVYEDTAVGERPKPGAKPLCQYTGKPHVILEGSANGQAKTKQAAAYTPKQSRAFARGVIEAAARTGRLAPHKVTRQPDHSPSCRDTKMCKFGTHFQVCHGQCLH